MGSIAEQWEASPTAEEAHEISVEEQLRRENQKLKAELATLKGSPPGSASAAGSTAAPAAAIVDPEAPAAAASSPPSGPRIVELTKAANQPLGVGVQRVARGRVLMVQYVKKDSVAQGLIRRKEYIYRINGQPVSCKTASDVAAVAKLLTAASKLSLVVNTELKVWKPKKSGGGCCGAARVQDENLAFGAGDRNGDGLLLKAELMEHLDGVANAEQASNLLAALDTDGDGKLSAEEYARMDTDGDGVVSEEEIQRAIANAELQAEMPEPTSANQLLDWRGGMYVAIPDPDAPAQQSPPPNRRRRQAEEETRLIRLIWTPAPTVSPTGYSSHEKWRSAAKKKA